MALVLLWPLHSTAAQCVAEGASALRLGAREWFEAGARAALDSDPRCAFLGSAMLDISDHFGADACTSMRRLEDSEWTAESADLLAIQAEMSLRCGKPLAAASLARATLRIDRGSHLAWLVLAEVLASRWRRESARAAFEQVLASDPRQPRALWGMPAVVDSREEGIAYFKRYLAVALSRGETRERIRMAGDGLAMLEALGDRETWTLKKADLPGTIPLTPLSTRLAHVGGWVLRCEIGDARKVPALLDSGASGLHVAPRTSRRARLDEVSSATLVGGGGAGRHAVRRGLYSHLDLGPLVYASPIGVVAPRSLHPRGAYRAIVGLDLFGGTEVEIDLDRRMMRIREAESLVETGDPLEEKIIGSGDGAIPLFRFEGQLLAPIEIRAGRRSVHTLALVDTGASKTLLDRSVAERLPGLRKGGRRAGRGYGGAIPYVGEVHSLRIDLGGAVADLRSVAVIDLAQRARLIGVRVGAFVGLDFIAQHRLIFDLESGTLKLPSSESARTEEARHR